MARVLWTGKSAVGRSWGQLDWRWPGQSSQPHCLFHMPHLGSSRDLGFSVSHLPKDCGPGVSGAPGPHQGSGGSVEFTYRLQVGEKDWVWHLWCGRQDSGDQVLLPWVSAPAFGPGLPYSLIWPLAKRRSENFGLTKPQWLFS